MRLCVCVYIYIHSRFHLALLYVISLLFLKLNIPIKGLSFFVYTASHHREPPWKMSSLSTVEARLPPGFRFHPRDEELICDYLMKWISGCAHPFPSLIQVDLNKCEPWDIPGNNYNNIFIIIFNCVLYIAD